MTSEYSEDVYELSSSSSEGENSDDDPEFKVDIEISKNLEIDDDETPKKSINLEKKKKIYRCHVCKKSFPFPNKVREHMKTHQINRYACHKCPGVHFDTFNHLRAHEGRFHSIANHKCPVCPYSNQRRFYVAQHFKRNHVEGIACTIAGCGLKFAKNKLKIHIREAHGGKKVRSSPKRAHLAFEKCPNCDFRPDDSVDRERRMEEIVEHVKNVHEPTSSSSRIPCTLNCGAQILVKNLLNHLNSTCPNFRTLTSSDDVVRTLTSDDVNSDSEDVFDSESVETLNSDDEELGEPSTKKAKLFDEFQCENCGKSCKNMNALRRHVKLNHSATSSATTTTSSTFEASKVRIRKEFRCERLQKNSELCGKVFRTAQALSDHHNVHDGLKPYKCVSCDQKFHARDRFAVHLQKYHQTSIKDLNANDLMLGLRIATCGGHSGDKTSSGGNSEGSQRNGDDGTSSEGLTSSGMNSEVATSSGVFSECLTSSETPQQKEDIVTPSEDSKSSGLPLTSFGVSSEGLTSSDGNSKVAMSSGVTSGELTSSGASTEVAKPSVVNLGDLTSSGTTSGDLTSSEVISEGLTSSETLHQKEDIVTPSENSKSSELPLTSSGVTSEGPTSAGTTSGNFTSSKASSEVPIASEEKPTSSDSEGSGSEKLTISELLTSDEKEPEYSTSSEVSSEVLTSSAAISEKLTSSGMNSEQAEGN